MITSTSNARIKRLVNLKKKRKLRDEEGVFLVEGIRMFREVPKDRLVEVYASEEFWNRERKAVEQVLAGTKVQPEILADFVFEYVSDTKTPQGILCLVRQKQYSITEIVKEKGAVFIMQIGKMLASGEPHDGRAPDYDDWSTIDPKTGLAGLNGDLLVWNDVLDRAMELSSMGIRVNKEAMLKQLELTGKEDREKLYFHRRLLEGSLPLSIGGGIGQSRLCMLLLDRAHVGEVQASLWPEEMRQTCREHDIILL